MPSGTRTSAGGRCRNHRRGASTHLASRLGVKDDHAFQTAYWKAFEQFFGTRNAEIVRGMLLAKYERADTGTGELDRVCFGLRQTMSWLAEAVERRALAEAGLKPPPEAEAQTTSRARRPSARKASRPSSTPASR